MEIIQMGSMYFGYEPFFIGSKYNERNLSIGNTVKGKEISWVNVNGLLVADHVICTNISWDDLDQQGFIFGKKVTIDGIPYFCRSLNVGSGESGPNEWDNILDTTGEDDSLWHWNNFFFWGQETSKYVMTYHAYRGGSSARNWLHNNASYRFVSVGFRTALEPLVPDSLISDSLVGTTIKAYGSGGNIFGTLSGFTDYDLFLSPTPESTPESNLPWFCRQEDGTVIIDRSAVTITKIM